MCTVPYVKDLSENIRRILRKLDIRTVFKTSTLGSLLTHVKDPVPAQDHSDVVYLHKCLDCGAEYIGETGRCLKKRSEDHEQAFEKPNRQASAVEAHCLESEHKFDWHKAKILSHTKGKCHIRVTEALQIMLNYPSVNQDQGWQVSPAWAPLLHATCKKL